MALLSLYQLPKKLTALRVAAGESQKRFAERASMDASQWCAIEKGRRRVSTRAMLDGLLTRLDVSVEGRTELALAFEHDRVIEQVSRTRLPDEAALLVSNCLQAVQVLDKDEVGGLVELVRSTIQSKCHLQDLVRRAPIGRRDAMD